MINPTPEDISSITPQELQTLKQQLADFTLLDVREPHEYELCNLEGVLIPLGELGYRLEEINREKPVIVHCRTDSRSQKAAELLYDAGFNVKYLKGGIIAWAQQIDPEVVQY